MKRLHYGTLTVDVADDLAEWVGVACTEFANNGQALAVPVSGYDLIGEPWEGQLVLGVGIPLAISDCPPRQDARNTLRCVAWIRDEVESLQQNQTASGE